MSACERNTLQEAKPRRVSPFLRADRRTSPRTTVAAIRERFLTENELAAKAGACPVTHASGQSHGVAFRGTCNKWLRKALTTLADNSRHASTWAASVYAKPPAGQAPSRGCKHAHTVRILARACLGPHALEGLE